MFDDALLALVFADGAASAGVVGTSGQINMPVALDGGRPRFLIGPVGRPT